MLRRLFLLLALFFLSLGAMMPAPDVLASEAGRRIAISKGADWFGNDYKTVKKVPLEACKAACLKDARCKAFTWNVKYRWCFLKNAAGELKKARGAIAGKVIAEPAQARAEAGDADMGAAPKPSFVPSSLMKRAESYRQAVRNDFRKELAESAEERSARAQGLMEEARRAEAGGDYRAAERLYRRAAAQAQDISAAWVGIARNLGRFKPNSNNEWRNIIDFRLSAAIDGYLVSRTRPDRFAALVQMARGLAGRKQWRPMLEAYKAALKLRDDAALREEFMAKRLKYGFRVAGHEVSADGKTPRICVDFSEALEKGRTDFTPWVRVDGAEPASLERQGARQLCIGGVRHGQRYRISLREGLPSSVGEKLLSPVTLEIFVRDRAPQARFLGESYILPKVGAKGIPVVSVNAQKVALKLYHVPPGAIGGLIKADLFPGLLDGYEVNQVTEDFGAKVWSGTVQVKGVLNKEVVTSVPLQAIVKERKAGLYLMSAHPASRPEPETWETHATQWFVVTDLGLSSFRGEGGLDVFARSLAGAGPVAGVKLRLMAKNNAVLGEAVADGQGHAHFAAGLLRGEGPMAPAMLLAFGKDGDFTFLDLDRDGFDLSDRGVAGRAPSGAVDAFSWLDRGIYRPGETVHAAAMLRNGRARALTGLPLTAVFTRPDGKEQKVLVLKDKGAGGYQADYVLPALAMRGTWEVAFYTDPDGEAVSQRKFLVEDFVPERLAMKLEPKTALIDPARGAEIAITGKYLYGAPAAGLWLEGEMRIKPVRSMEGFKGYLFGLADEKGGTARVELSDLAQTDAQGHALVKTGAIEVPQSTRPQVAAISLRLAEAGGRAIERSVSLPIAMKGAAIGIRPDFEGTEVEEDSHVAFSVLAVDRMRKRTAMAGVKWVLYRLVREYQWAKTADGWSYEPVTYTQKKAEGVLDLTTGAAGRITADVTWGRYRLEVTGPGGEDAPVSSVIFDAGWYSDSASLDTPDALQLALDKQAYRPGDVARVSFRSRFAGKGLLIVGAESLESWQVVDVREGDNTIELPVKDWGAGSYVSLTAFRPGRDGDAYHLPKRAIGIHWLKIDPAARRLTVRMEVPQQVLPRQKVRIPVFVANVRPGQVAHVTVALVDEGILSLTGFATPDPDGWYFGQRKLGLEILDQYGRLIDGRLGAPGLVHSGGDGPGGGLKAKGSPPTQPLLALHSGIVTLDASGKGEVVFDLPQFNGRGRLMAVAWTEDSIGHGESPLVIRDPVVVLASAPRFLALDDRARVRLDIANMDGPAGEYALEVAADGGLKVDTPALALVLEKGARKALDIPLTAADIGLGHVTVTLRKGHELSLSQTLTIPVRASQPPVMRKRALKLAAGGSIRLDGDLLAGLIPASAQLTLNVSHLRGIDVPSLLMALDRYPHGCAEQTTSRALPLVYLPQVAMKAGFGEMKEIRGRVQKAIDRLVAFQGANGGFGIWGPGNDLWLTAYVTDFLTRAREEKYAVSETVLKLALNFLKNTLAEESNSVSPAHGYALYVLARNRQASIGDLRWMAESKLGDLKTPLAMAQVGAALALYGDQRRARRAFKAAFAALQKADRKLYGHGYGSVLRDGAAVLALAGETRPVAAQTEPLEAFIARVRERRRHTSTQENAWLLLAARALLARDKGLRFDVNGMKVSGSLFETYKGEELDAAPVTVRNGSAETLTAVVTTRGVPRQPQAAGGEGFVISRAYFTLDGKPADISQAAQNERFVVVLKVKELKEHVSQVLVTDMLPAGFEIDNPRLMTSAKLSNFDFLPEEAPRAHLEYRDDRFIAALSRGKSDKREFTLAYMVRAVTPGTYALPPAMVEDMYRPWLNARTASGRMRVFAPK